MSQEIIKKIENKKVGEAVELLKVLWAFRLPKHRYRYGQSYLVIRDKRAFLVDAVHSETKEAIKAILEKNNATVVAIILTHGHLIGQLGGTSSEVSSWFNNAPILAHPSDITSANGIQEIIKNMELLSEFNLQFEHFGGHTPGSIIIHYPKEGLVFSGDVAIGSPYDSEDNVLDRPPLQSTDETQVIDMWSNMIFEPNAILPLHGKPVFGEENVKHALVHLVKKDSIMK